LIISSYFFFYFFIHHRDLHSFPTRRSSDLVKLGQGPPHAGDLPLSEIVNIAKLRWEHPYGFKRNTFVIPELNTINNAAYWDYQRDRKSTRLNSSHLVISYAVFCLKKKIIKTSSGFHRLDPPSLHHCLAPLQPVYHRVRRLFAATRSLPRASYRRLAPALLHGDVIP